MNQVIILTENIENELPMFENLRRLNYEVLISQKTVTYFDDTGKLPNWIDIFSIILLSETLTNEKVESICAELNNTSHICLLKIDQRLNSEEQIRLKKIGADYFIYTKHVLSPLRETLSEIEKKQTQCLPKIHRLDNHSMNLFLSKLSPLSTRLFLILQQLNGEIITREELSKKIWGKCSNATLSQLSLCVKKINNQIYTFWNIPQGILTEWGKGYRFNQELCTEHQNQELNYMK